MIGTAENIGYKTTVKKRIFLLIEQVDLEKAIFSAQELISNIKSAITKIDTQLSPLSLSNNLNLGWILKKWEEINLVYHQEKIHYYKVHNKKILAKIFIDIEEKTEEYIAILEKTPHLLDQKMINSLYIIKEWWNTEAPSQLKNFEWWNHYFEIIEHYNFLHRTIKDNLPLFTNIYLELN